MWRERDGYIGCTSVRPQPTILHMTSFFSSTLSFEHELSAIPNSAWSTFYPDQSGLFLQVPFLENQSCSRKRQPLWRRCSLINYTSHLSTHQCSRISTEINYKPSLHRSDIKENLSHTICSHISVQQWEQKLIANHGLVFDDTKSQIECKAFVHGSAFSDMILLSDTEWYDTTGSSFLEADNQLCSEGADQPCQNSEDRLLEIISFLTTTVNG